MKPWVGFLIFWWITRTAAGAVVSPDFSTGTWYKVGFPTGGVYYLDQRWMQAQGLPWRSIRPSQVRIWAGDPQVLPQKISPTTSIPQDLQEIPLYATFAQDRWDRSGRLYFYVAPAQKPGEEKHPYSDSSYVYLTWGESPSNRHVRPQASFSSTAQLPSQRVVTQTLETEVHSLVRSGRHWLGEYLSAGLTTRTWSLPTPGRLPDTPVVLLGQGVSTTTFEGTLRTDRSDVRLPRVGTGRYDRKGQWVTWTETWPAASWNDRLSLTYTPTAGANGGFYLDRLTWQYARLLDFDHEPFLWTGTGVIEATSSGWAWAYPRGDLHPVSVGRWKLPEDPTTWVLWKETQARPAGASRRVDLSGPAFRPAADMLLITAPEFSSQAREYATWKEQVQGLRVDVWTTEQLFARYSAGMPDPTALRNAILAYYRAGKATLRHVLLMGDASYDYKNYLRFPATGGETLVPTYISRESLEPIYSFNSDDYFGFLEEGEGEWPEGERRGGFWWNDPSGSHTLDISVGRLPVRTVEQARAVVDKLIRYQSAVESPRGLVWAADDGDDWLHHQDAESLADFVFHQRPDIPQQKIYLGAFEERQADRIPQATATFFRVLEDQPLMVNYTGHGSELALAEERLFESELISRWRNVPTPPIWVTATCEFGRFDNPALVSSGESLVLAPNGGSIALLTTTRPVFSNTNFILNFALYQELLLGETPTLGELFRRTKNLSIVGVLNRNFTLLGDPSLPLRWPPSEIQIRPLDDKGLAFEGIVGDPQGNGTIVAEVFLPEKISTVKDPTGATFSFRTEAKGPVFTFPVENGKFLGNIPDTFPSGEGLIRWYWKNRSGVSRWQKRTNSSDTQPPVLVVTSEPSGAIMIRATDPSGLYQGIWPDPATAQYSWDGQQWFPFGGWRKTPEGTYEQILVPPVGSARQITLRIADSHTNQAIGTFEWEENNLPLQIEAVQLYPNPVTGPLQVAIAWGEEWRESDVTVEFFDSMGARLYVRTESCYICDPIWRFSLPEPLPSQGGVVYRVRIVHRWNQQTFQTQGRLYFAR